MMESPRSAKRRKLSTSTPNSTAKPTSTRSSARKANTPVAAPNGRTNTSAKNNVPIPTAKAAVTKPEPVSTSAVARPKPAAPAARSSLRRSLPAPGNTKSIIDIYDDIEGAHKPATTLTPAAIPAAASPAPSSLLTRSASTIAVKKDTEKSEISTKAGHKGLNSLRARLEAKIAAAAAAKRAEAGDQVGAIGDASGAAGKESGVTQGDRVNDATSRGQSAKPDAVAEDRIESGREIIEIDAYERDQIEKAIKRMAAKEANRKRDEEKIRWKAEGGTGRMPARAGTPKTNANVKEKAMRVPGARKNAKANGKVAVAEEEVPEDTSCKICGKLNSPKHNMIVMCDGCDNAYHQKCHEPNISPKVLKDDDSDWFCAECMFKMKVNATSVAKKDGPAAPRRMQSVDDSSNHVVPSTERQPSPAKSAKKRPTPRLARELSPMILDLPEERAAQQTPSKAPTSAKPLLKPQLRKPPSKPRPSASRNLSFSSADLQVLQHTVLEQLTGRRSNTLIGLENETTQIANLVDQTISSGESNSLLVIGARGSGKTAVVNSILASHSQTQPDAFHVVRLNGFIHTDDKIALREIWRQLGREMQTEDIESAGSKNYADALTTLLALLSHHSEIGQAEGHEEDGEVKSKSVVFVLDEFDMFTTHPRQTLLYNLFDIAQSRKAPILVLGLTTRFDVAEQLEKRVKSRFSHRFVHLGLAKNLDFFTEMCLSCLTPASSDETDISAEGVEAWTAVLTDLVATSEMQRLLRQIYYTTKSLPALKSSLLIPLSTLPTTQPSRVAAAGFDPEAEGEGNGEGAENGEQDQTIVPTTTILTHLTSSLPSSSSSSSSTHQNETSSSTRTATATTTTPPDSKLPLLHTLSTLQLSLLIAAARLTIIHDTDAVSFALAYEEYKTLASRARIASTANASSFSTSASASASGGGSGGSGGIIASGVGRVWSKDVARGAWEGLVGLEFVIGEGGAGAGVGSGAGGRGKGGIGAGGDGVGGRVDVLLEEIRESGVEMGVVMGRWCREI